MKTARRLLLPLVVMFFSVGAAAQTQRVTVSGALTPIESGAWGTNVRPNLIEATGQIADAEGAEAIITALLANTAGGTGARSRVTADEIKKKDFYCIIHVLRWSNATPPTAQAQNWYVYNNRTLTRGNPTEFLRIYGAKRLTFLYLHLNAENNYEPLYEFEIVKKTPAYLNRLLGLAGLYNSLTGNAATGGQARMFYGVRTFDVEHRPSDITATAKVIKSDASVMDLASTQKFDNEGKYFADFSVGVPVRRISQLNFDSVNNTVSAQEVDKQNVFAFVNLHPKAVDIKKNSANLVPHFVGGVAMAKKPLDKIFVGAGFGPVFTNFYVGALFVKQDQLTTLQPGDPATPAQLEGNLRRRYKAQVGFGLNLPVGAIVEKLKN